MPSSYDSWLEAPYQRELEQGEAYEHALELEASRIQAELEQLTVQQLLDAYPQFSAKPQDILMAMPADPLAVYKTYRFSLEEVFLALVAEQAEAALQNAPQEYDGPEPDDFLPADLDQDCDYWRRTK